MDRDTIVAEAARLAPPEAAALLTPLPDADVAALLRVLNPAVAEDVLLRPGEERRRAVIAAAPPDDGRQWARNLTYPDDSVGRVMEPPHAVLLRPHGGGGRRAHPRAGEDHVRDLRLRDRRGRGPPRRRDDARPPAGRHRSSPRRRHAPRPLLSSPADAAPRGGPPRGGPALPRLPRAPCWGPSGRGRARSDALRGARPGAHRPAGGHGRRREGGAPSIRRRGPRSLRFRHPWLHLNLFTAFVAAAVVGAFRARSIRWWCSRSFLPVLAGQLRAIPAARRSR